MATDDDFLSAVNRAAALFQSGQISQQQYDQLYNKITALRATNPPGAPTVAVPMPQPDPRGGTFSQRIPQQMDTGPSEARQEIPPDVMLQARGIDTTRKQGDAMDWNTNPALPWYPRRGGDI